MGRHRAPSAARKAATRVGMGGVAIGLSLAASSATAASYSPPSFSSSHRAMNKMAMALQEGRISGGALVLPSRKMYHHEGDPVWRRWS